MDTCRRTAIGAGTRLHSSDHRIYGFTHNRKCTMANRSTLVKRRAIAADSADRCFRRPNREAVAHLDPLPLQSGSKGLHRRLFTMDKKGCRASLDAAPPCKQFPLIAWAENPLIV